MDLSKTTFYMEDRGTSMVVPNEQLKELTVERQLPEGPLELQVRRSDRIPEDK